MNFVFKETILKFGNKIEFDILDEDNNKIGFGELLQFNTKNSDVFRKSNSNYNLDIEDALKSINIVEEYKYDKIKNRIKYNCDAIKKGHPVYGEVAILKKIVLEENFRGKGMGDKSMSILKEALQLKGLKFLILRPEPLELGGANEIERIKNRIEPLKRLIGFYERNGFVITGKPILTTYGAEIIHMIFEI